MDKCLTYKEIKDFAYQIFIKHNPGTEVLFRNTENFEIVIITWGMKKKPTVDALSNSGLFKTRKFKDAKWKFNILSDKNIYQTFKLTKSINYASKN